MPLEKGFSTIYIPSGKHKNNKKIPVDVYIPKGKQSIRGTILVLPGWKYNRKLWRTKTNIIKVCEEKGFRLVFPEMGKSLYASQYFPQTVIKWSVTPGGQWIQEYLLPTLQQYGLLLPGDTNFMLGLSTGARGVALISLRNPGLFKGGACLSGDFDQTAIPKDVITIRIYGPYEEHKDRWETVDNPQSRITEWKMPVYLGHGQADTVTPYSQSYNFYHALKKAHPSVRVVLNAPEKAGHDWTYWSSEVLNVMNFFLSLP